MNEKDTQAVALALVAANQLAPLSRVLNSLGDVLGGFALVTRAAIKAGLLSETAMLEWISSEFGRAGAAEFEKFLQRLMTKA